MTTHQTIDDRNAESIGRPILDKIIQSFANSDREELILHFPELHKLAAGIFNEAAENLNRLGERLSSEYSSHSMEKGYHILIWKVQYANDDNTVHWKLFLHDSQAGIEVKGFGFDR